MPRRLTPFVGWVLAAFVAAPIVVPGRSVHAQAFFTKNDDFLGAALDATYYTGGRTTIDGEKGQQQENVRLGLTTALSMSRHRSIKLYGSTGVYSGTDNNFWAVGIASQYRWGGGL